jgi:hypothetical protein
MSESIQYRPEDVRWFDTHVPTSADAPVLAEAHACAVGVEDALTISPCELVLLGEALERLRAQQDAGTLTITEAPEPEQAVMHPPTLAAWVLAALPWIGLALIAYYRHPLVAWLVRVMEGQ